ncbi:MAG: hypothetical protein QNI91_08220 [Arenicellales bacterium]|nr:hypothetical protein [Arenicellales bacterium]
MNSFVDLWPTTESFHMPCVPLTDAQTKDYRDLMTRAEALQALGRYQESRRIKQVASDILRTGAPNLD